MRIITEQKASKNVQPFYVNFLFQKNINIQKVNVFCDEIFGPKTLKDQTNLP